MAISPYDRFLEGDYSALKEMPEEVRRLMKTVSQDIANNDWSSWSSLIASRRDGYVYPFNEFIRDDKFMGEEFGNNFIPAWKDELEYVLDYKNRINIWFIRGSMGTGKSFSGTFGSFYRMYDVTMWRDPAAEFGLMPDSPIVFGLFNATKYLADDVSYSYLTQFINTCNYFSDVREQVRKNDLRKRIRGNALNLPKNVRVAIGSDEFQILGKNLFCGILDEANWRDRILSPAVQDKVYGSFGAMARRIKTRFDSSESWIPTLLIAISSEREMSSVMDQLCDEYGDEPYCHITKFSLWDTDPRENDHIRFYVGIPNQSGLPPRMFEDRHSAEEYSDMGRVISIPKRFQSDFSSDIYGALNDIAGVRVETGEVKFFYLENAMYDCIDKERQNPIKAETIVHGMSSEEDLSEYFDKDEACVVVDAIRNRYVPKHHPKSLRAIHIDLSINHDATGISCACPGTPIMQEIETFRKVKLPEYVTFVDFMLRLKAPPGSRIHYAAIRKFIVWLNQECGYPIGLISLDGFESEDTYQILTDRGYKVMKLSMDKTMVPYTTFRDTVNARRILMPYHSLAMAEMNNLQRVKKKNSNNYMIDHPKMMTLNGKKVEGSKDVADSIGAVNYNIVTEGVFKSAFTNDLPKVPPTKSETTHQQKLTEYLKRDERRSLRDIILEGGKGSGRNF